MKVKGGDRRWEKREQRIEVIAMGHCSLPLDQLVTPYNLWRLENDSRTYLIRPRVIAFIVAYIFYYDVRCFKNG